MHETAQLRSPGVLSRSQWQHSAKPPAPNSPSPVYGTPALLRHRSVTPRFRLFVRRMQIMILRVKLRGKYNGVDFISAEVAAETNQNMAKSPHKFTI